MIICKNCHETWDKETPGYAEAKQSMIDWDDAFCPGCEHTCDWIQTEE